MRVYGRNQISSSSDPASKLLASAQSKSPSESPQESGFSVSTLRDILNKVSPEVIPMKLAL
jgi:hypothetical protein